MPRFNVYVVRGGTTPILKYLQLSFAVILLTGCGESIEARHKREFAEALTKAEKGDAKAMESVGSSYHMGRGTTRNAALAETWWKKCWALDNINCAVSLAHLYHSGAEGMQKDFIKARQLYELVYSRTGGWVEYNLADMYRRGEGGPARYEDAANLYRIVIRKQQDRFGDPLVMGAKESLKKMQELGQIRRL